MLTGSSLIILENGTTTTRIANQQPKSHCTHFHTTSTGISTNIVARDGSKGSTVELPGDDRGPPGDGASAKPGVLGPSGQGRLGPRTRGSRDENMGRDIEAVWIDKSDQYNEFFGVGVLDESNIPNTTLLPFLPIPPQSSTPLLCPDGPIDSVEQPRRNHGKQPKQRGRNISLGVSKARQPGEEILVNLEVRNPETHVLDKLLLRDFDESIPSVMLAHCPSRWMACTLNLRIKTTEGPPAVALNSVISKGSRKGKEI